MKVALDTTYILGRGAVKDTYNLLADGIVKLVRALSEVGRSDLDEWAAARGYERYVSSVACIDWDDKKARDSGLGDDSSRRTQELSCRRRPGSCRRTSGQSELWILIHFTAVDVLPGNVQITVIGDRPPKVLARRLVACQTALQLRNRG